MSAILKKMVNITTLSSFLVWNLALAIPEGGSVAQGGAAISQSGATTTITQASQNAVINWSGFDTASHETVNFVQPNSSAIALNRINSGQPTSFAGTLSANGQVWIVNPNGILFTSSSSVNVAGLLATTHDIADANFMIGHYKFDIPGTENAKIINNGLITARDSGIVALVAPWVENNGVITAHLGKVALSSGAAFVLDMYGDSLINFGSSAPLQGSYISNSGVIQADGGKVHITANSAAGVLDNIISMSGTIEAKSVGVNKKGEIVLHSGHSGSTYVSGKLKASSNDKSLGGFIETSGAYLEIAPAAEIEAGMGGTWLVDPRNITVIAGSGLVNNGGALGFIPTGGGSQIGATLISNQLASGTNVTLDTGVPGGNVGNITIASDISWSTSALLTLIAANNIVLNAAINGGALGFVTLNAGGEITQNSNGIITAELLTTSSVSGTRFNSATMSVNRFNAANSNSGNIRLTNSGGLDITGISQNGQNLIIVASGPITQSGAIYVSGTSSFDANANHITLTDNNNQFVGGIKLSTSGAGNDARLFNDIATRLDNTSVGGVLTVRSKGDVTVEGPVSSSERVRIISTQGNIILNSTVQGSAGGDNAIVLEGKNLINNYGPNALITTSGDRFLVYLEDVNALSNSVFGGLDTANQAVWGETRASLPPSSAPDGNRYIFSYQPPLTLTTTDGIKNFGDDLTGVVGSFFSVTGFVDASLYGNVFTQDTLGNTLLSYIPASLGAFSFAVPGFYGVISNAAATTGYALVVNNAGVITVNIAPLAVLNTIPGVQDGLVPFVHAEEESETKIDNCLLGLDSCDPL